MSNRDVAANVQRAIREREAIPDMIDALQRMLNRDPDAWRWAEAALAKAGHPWDQPTYTLRRKLKRERT